MAHQRPPRHRDARHDEHDEHSEHDEHDETPTPATRAAHRAQQEGEARFQRAKAWAQEQGLLRLEVESPSGRAVIYKDPALYLEAFAAEEVHRSQRQASRQREE